MFENDHTCCICRERGKDVQIHHIDGNHANNADRNLAVLCLDCHSRVTGRRGLGRSFSVAEVRKYKVDWESLVRKRRSLSSGPPSSLTKLERDLLKFETKNQIYHLSATADLKRAKEILGASRCSQSARRRSRIHLGPVVDGCPVLE